MSKHSIMIVEDEIYIRDSLAEYFRYEDYEVGVAERGEEALEIIQNKHFDVFIVDIRLSGIDGTRTITRIKQIQPNAKFFVFTGSLEFHITPDLEALGLREKYVVYKPISDLAIIADKIRELINEKD